MTPHGVALATPRSSSTGYVTNGDGCPWHSITDQVVGTALPSSIRLRITPILSAPYFGLGNIDDADRNLALFFLREGVT